MLSDVCCRCYWQQKTPIELMLLSFTLTKQNKKHTHRHTLTHKMLHSGKMYLVAAWWHQIYQNSWTPSHLSSVSVCRTSCCSQPSPVTGTITAAWWHQINQNSWTPSHLSSLSVCRTSCCSQPSPVTGTITAAWWPHKTPESWCWCVWGKSCWSTSDKKCPTTWPRWAPG